MLSRHGKKRAWPSRGSKKYVRRTTQAAAYKAHPKFKPLQACMVAAIAVPSSVNATQQRHDGAQLVPKGPCCLHLTLLPIRALSSNAALHYRMVEPWRSQQWRKGCTPPLPFVPTECVRTCHAHPIPHSVLPPPSQTSTSSPLRTVQAQVIGPKSCQQRRSNLAP